MAYVREIIPAPIELVCTGFQSGKITSSVKEFHSVSLVLSNGDKEHQQNLHPVTAKQPDTRLTQARPLPNNDC